MEHVPDTPQIEPMMREMFRLFPQSVIDKEKREGQTAHFTGIEMNLDDICDEDIVMYLRIKENPGYTLPTGTEFKAYRDAVSLSNNVTRYALVAYLGNMLTPILVSKELKDLESQG